VTKLPALSCFVVLVDESGGGPWAGGGLGYRPWAVGGGL
jgi:hypothetical protein